MDSKRLGSDFGLEGAENGLERLEYDGDARRSPIGACTLASALQKARARSTAAKTVTETEIPQIMKDSVSVRTAKPRNGLDRSCR
jgi:hypothetical protein